jgi:CMP-N-acetylneuraminic acid synthetase
VMSQDISIDIDTKIDFMFARNIFENKS